MQNKILLSTVVVLSAVYLNIRSLPSDETSSFNINQNINVLDEENNKIINIDVENYLIGVLAGEMPASFNYEALKAQAIASRTYAYYKIKISDKDYDLTNDTRSQMFISDNDMHKLWGNEYDKYLSIIKNAINDTSNMVMTYNNEIISAYYFSMSNGYTENVQNVFGEQKEYLQSVESKEDESNQNFMVTKVFKREEFCSLLNILCDDITITNIEKTSSNRINKITINNKEFTGINIRDYLDLRSTDFEININNNEILITTKGYGHGVGMSQYGANTMANDGYNYEQILKHYYKGIEIKNINNV